MNQRTKLLNLIVDFCNEKGCRTFYLSELNEFYGNFNVIDIGGNTPQATVRRLLQELRDEENIEFLDNHGAYFLKGIPILKDEIEERAFPLINETKTKIEKEYIIEIYARNRGWVKQAKEILGSNCLYPKCSNTFIKEDGTPYIEVHHIIPLFLGGDDGIWNLTVICAHHHRMAHYADAQMRSMLEKIFIQETQCRI